MKSNLKITLAGFLISFLGALPVGTLNATAFRLSGERGAIQAGLFVLAAVLVELLIVKISLSSFSKIKSNKRIMHYLLPISALALFGMAVSEFFHYFHRNEVSDYLPMIQSTFLLGLLMSLANPLQYPFWLGWNTALSSRNILTQDSKNNWFYILGIGVGSLLVFGLFLFLGKIILSTSSKIGMMISLIMGGIYLLFGSYLVYTFSKNIRTIKA